MPCLPACAPQGSSRQMRKETAALLRALGVTGAGKDPMLDMVVDMVAQRIQNETNRTDIPEGLQSAAVSMAAGEYLRWKKAAGQLEGFALEEAAVKQIQEGDTSISFAVGEGAQTPEQRLDALIASLTGRQGEIYRYRRLVW